MNSITWSLNHTNTFNLNTTDLDQVRLIKNILAGFPIVKNTTIRDHNYHGSMYLKNEINGHIVYYVRSEPLPQFLQNNGIRYEVFVITFKNNYQCYLFNNLLRSDFENNQVIMSINNISNIISRTDIVPYMSVPETITMNMPCVVYTDHNWLSHIEHKLEQMSDSASIISFLNFANMSINKNKSY